MSSATSEEPSGTIPLMEKMYRFSAPLTAVAILLYVILNFVKGLDVGYKHPSQSPDRDNYDARVLSIMEQQAQAITLLSKNSTELQTLLSDDTKMLKEIHTELSNVEEAHQLRIKKSRMLDLSKSDKKDE
jgi:hypothetical protein